MNVEIGAEAAQFPEKEYINAISVAVCDRIPGCDHDPAGHRIDLNLEGSAACGLVVAPVCFLVVQT